MTSRKKILLWSSGIVGLLTAVLIAVIVLAPMYLDSQGVKNKIQAAVSEKLGGKVSYERIDVSLFPLPHVIIRQLHLAYPRTFSGQLQSITIYPHVFPLFRGKLQFSKIQVQEPDFTIILPAVVSESTPTAPVSRGNESEYPGRAWIPAGRSAPVLSLKWTTANSCSNGATGIFSPFGT